MELVDSPPAPANKYDWRLEDSDHEDEEPGSPGSPQKVDAHVEDPNGFVDKSSVALGHDPNAKPKKSAFSMTSAFSFKARKSTTIGSQGGSVVAETTGGERKTAKDKGIKFSSKKYIREITGRSRSQKARTRELEEEGSACIVM